MGTTLTEVDARQLTARIRDALALADDLLVQAYERGAWLALGYDSFSAYCRGELPELRVLKMRAPARRERARALRDAGATIPEIVVATGSSLGSIHRDLTTPSFQMETAGRVNEDRPASLSAVDRVAALVAAQGDRGLTYIEVCAATGWRGGQATGALSRAEKRGLICRVPAFRLGCSAYVSLSG